MRIGGSLVEFDDQIAARTRVIQGPQGLSAIPLPQAPMGFHGRWHNELLVGQFASPVFSVAHSEVFSHIERNTQQRVVGKQFVDQPLGHGRFPIDANR